MNARNDLEFQTVYELAQEISMERSEVLMTIAEKLIGEGIEKEREEGKEKGKLEVAENLLRLGMKVDMMEINKLRRKLCGLGLD